MCGGGTHVTRTYNAGDHYRKPLPVAGTARFCKAYFDLVLRNRWCCVATLLVKQWTVTHISSRQTENTVSKRFFRDATRQNARRDFWWTVKVVVRSWWSLGVHVHSVANFTTSFETYCQPWTVVIYLSVTTWSFFRNSCPGTCAS
jgi:hypothetical protein